MNFLDFLLSFLKDLSIEKFLNWYWLTEIICQVSETFKWAVNLDIHVSVYVCDKWTLIFMPTTFLLFN